VAYLLWWAFLLTPTPTSEDHYEVSDYLALGPILLATPAVSEQSDGQKPERRSSAQEGIDGEMEIEASSIATDASVIQNSHEVCGIIVSTGG